MVKLQSHYTDTSFRAERTYQFNGKFTQNNNNYYVNSILFTTFATLIVRNRADKVLVFTIYIYSFIIIYGMRKFYYLLLMLFMGVTTAAFAGESGPHAWEGKNKTLTLAKDTVVTFSYIAAEDGTLYIYSDNQGSSDNVPLTLQGGLYQNGAYVEDSSLQDVGAYENGLGLYGWIDVQKGNEIRFAISTSKDAEGSQTRFTLKSAFFNKSVGGNSWENAISLTQDVAVTIPVRPNDYQDILDNIWSSNVTFCEFTAPSDGVATILTTEYLVYVLEKEYVGDEEKSFSPVSQDVSTNDHEFIVRKGVDYVVVVPNTHPATLTFKMTQKALGQSAKFPLEITEFPATIDLKKGDNFYVFSHELVDGKNMLEVAVAAGWNGTITYMEDPTENSTELAAEKVAGEAATFAKNIDPRYLYGTTLIVNFNMSDKDSFAEAATLSLREPAAGESYDTAIAAKWGENAINGPAGDYWFAYTAEMDAEYSFATTGTLKHINFVAGVELKVADNVYRIGEGQTVYACVTTTTAEGNTFTVSGTEIKDGDYCDRPIYFELGQEVTIANRGRDSFHAFIAEENGHAVFTSVNWTLNFYDECGGRRLNNTLTVEDGDDVKYTYKLPVSEGQLYIVEVTALSEDITITTGFEAAVSGDVCATAVAINTLEENINIDYTFAAVKWFKYTAEKDGFYNVKAKLGYAANMTTKIGDCDAAEINAGSDNSANNAYMGGYKAAKVYLVEGQTLYIYTKTGNSNDEEQFSAEFYLSVSYVGEARPGEDVAVAIQAVANKEYDILKNDADGYEQWYTYTIPAGKEAVFTLSTVVKYLTNNFSFYREDKATNMSSGKGDFTQENITNEKNETIGKRITFAAADEARTIYFKLSTVNAKFYPDPVVWQIICDDNTGIIVEEVADEAPVIYDLMGRRVENPGKGIYIVNGVKRIFR